MFGGEGWDVPECDENNFFAMSWRKNDIYTEYMGESNIFAAHCYGITEVISSSNRWPKAFKAFSCIALKIKSPPINFFPCLCQKEKSLDYTTFSPE